jgi:hypothetical protein
MVWVLSVLLPQAHAFPDRVAKTFEVGTALQDVAVSADGDVVAFVDSGSDSVFILDAQTWEVSEIDVCPGAVDVTPWPHEDARFYVGCSEGELAWFEVNDGEVSFGDAIVGVVDTKILKVAANSNHIFVVAEHPDAGNPQVHAYDPTDGTMETSIFPVTLYSSSVEDMEADLNYVFVSHGGSNMSKVTLTSGYVARQLGTISSAGTSDVLLVNSSRVLVAGGAAGVLDLQVSNNFMSVLLDASDGVDNATALVVQDDGEWLAVCDSEQDAILIHEFDNASGLPTSQQFTSIALPDIGGSVEEFAYANGYLFGATAQGALHVVTDRPWVNVYRASPSSALVGAEITVGFDANVTGSWTARLGADSNANGVVMASGSVTEDEPEQAIFTVTDAFKEGENRIRIVVEDGDGRTGHDSATVDVDNPPSVVVLENTDVGFGDGQIQVEINGIDDDDLSHYMVYVSSISFEAADYSTEGPAFVGVEEDVSANSLDLPRQVNADPSTDKSITIKPLTNGVTYYVAVRAYDEAGQEGPMSNVVSENPRETFGAAELAGDEGGLQCGSVAGPAAGLLALLGGLLCGIRRQTLPVAALLIGMSFQPAQAEVSSDWPQKGTEWSDFVGTSFQFRHSRMTMEDENLTDIFGDGVHKLWALEWGPTFFELIELTGSTGFYRATGKLVDADGVKSAQDDKIVAIPFMLNATFRLDVLPEQVIVPFAGVGYDYWMWKESWDGGDSVSGGKSGMHTTYGAHLLLDIFQPARASRLEASTGITDSFITVEYRTQTIGEDQGGLLFSGDVLTFGLKLDY